MSAKLLLYIPTYNCEKFIYTLLDSIPKNLLSELQLLVVDNQSQDRTVHQIKQWFKSSNATGELLIPKNNLGYAGSQKLAYNYFLQHTRLSHILMLHGDNQYDPTFISEFSQYSHYDVVSGVRSKRKYFKQDETPWIAYFIIKTLSLIESTVLNTPLFEWHSGYVMYSRNFLERINWHKITSVPHIDGHLLFVAHSLKMQIKTIKIYKRYKNLVAFEGLSRLKYVANVFKLMHHFRFTSPSQYSLGDKKSSWVQADYTVEKFD